MNVDRMIGTREQPVISSPPQTTVTVTVDNAPKSVHRGRYVVSQFKADVGVDASRALDEAYCANRIILLAASIPMLIVNSSNAFPDGFSFHILIGMDVHDRGERYYIISGQVALSMPDEQCLWCMGLLTEPVLAAEAQRYGAAGSRPQVVWPNGLLASAAVGLFVQAVTPSCTNTGAILLEYDGNTQTVMPSNKLSVLQTKSRQHYATADRGDPFFHSRVRNNMLQDS